MHLDIMTRAFVITVLLATYVAPVYAEQSIQLSHIEANVPPQSSFATLMKRDLLAFFRNQGFDAANSITYKLLRDAPTQSGVAYPKYYAWVQVFGDDKILMEGAVRLAAIDRTHFEVTNFLSRAKLKVDPGLARTVFPAALINDVISMAGAN